MLNFCIIPKDEKSYIYSKKYLTYIKDENRCNIMIFDNKLQKIEISDHIRKNNIKFENSDKETQKWIECNAEKFRTYLNSLKVFTLMINNNCGEYTFNEFCILADIYNNIKKDFIDSIY